MLEEKIKSLFNGAKYEHFEDGVENSFSKELVLVIKQYGNDAMYVIKDLITHEKVHDNVAEEALRCLGHMGRGVYYKQQFDILISALKCSSPWICDSAGLGLSYLDDPTAIPYIKEVIVKEKHPLVKKYMTQVLEQLENTQEEIN